MKVFLVCLLWNIGLVLSATEYNIVRNDRIIGGSIARRNQFPYQVAIIITLGNGGQTFCAGSILNNNYILSNFFRKQLMSRRYKENIIFQRLLIALIKRLAWILWQGFIISIITQMENTDMRSCHDTHFFIVTSIQSHWKMT